VLERRVRSSGVSRSASQGELPSGGLHLHHGLSPGRETLAVLKVTGRKLAPCTARRLEHWSALKPRPADRRSPPGAIGSTPTRVTGPQGLASPKTGVLRQLDTTMRTCVG
jgi:hypothetical protein